MQEKRESRLLLLREVSWGSVCLYLSLAGFHSALLLSSFFLSVSYQ